MANDAHVQRLIARFIEMAVIREDRAARIRSGYSSEAVSASGAVIVGLENAAQAYRRCAEELQRVANGEEPAEPGMRWD